MTTIREVTHKVGFHAHCLCMNKGWGSGRGCGVVEVSYNHGTGQGQIRLFPPSPLNCSQPSASPISTPSPFFSGLSHAACCLKQGGQRLPSPRNNRLNNESLWMGVLPFPQLENVDSQNVDFQKSTWIFFSNIHFYMTIKAKFTHLKKIRALIRYK